MLVIMKVPGLEEVKVSTRDPAQLKSHLERIKVGESPFYLDCTGLTILDFENVLQRLEEVFAELSVSPNFPYPFYLLSEYHNTESTFPIFKDYDDLPEFFKIESSRVTLKEQRVLEKVQILCSHITNEDIDTRIEEFKANLYPQKIIKSLAKEGHFLETIALTLKENKKSRNNS